MLKRLRGKLQLRVPFNRLGHRPRQADVVRDHRPVSGRARLPQREPHLQGAEAARVLRAVVHVVRGALIEMVVRRVVGERGAQGLRVAHQRASGFERRVEPLVRIDRHGIGQAQPAQVVGSIGQRCREAAVGAIHVKPRAVLPAHRRDVGQRVDGARADRPGGADHQQRHVAGRGIRLDLPAQRGHVHAEIAHPSGSTGSTRCRAPRGPRPSGSTCAFRPIRTRGACAPARRPRRARGRPSRPSPRAPPGSRRSSPCCRRSRAARRSQPGSR